MKSLSLCLLALLILNPAASSAGEPVKGAAKDKKAVERKLPGWGKAADPDGDCQFFLADGTLLINVPGARAHDLAAEIGRVNAPRVLQEVRGDFTLQVKVEGRFTPGAASTQTGRTGYNGAALVVLADAKNVVTLARAVLHHEGKAAAPYANFEIRAGGKLERIGMTGDQALPGDGPVFLRLERRGNQFLGAVSTDGLKWSALESKPVPPDWPLTLQAGVAAISTSEAEFSPRFSKLQLLQ